MFLELKIFCEKTIPVTQQELELIDKYFEERTLHK